MLFNVSACFLFFLGHVLELTKKSSKDSLSQVFPSSLISVLQRADVSIEPRIGTVPAGGKRRLNLVVTPDSVGKFEATLKVHHGCWDLLWS